MQKTYNKKQRKAIYLKLAQEFEFGEQDCGLCKAFNEYCNGSYYPYSLLKVFPELKLIWFEKYSKEMNSPYYTNHYTGFVDYNEETNHNEEARKSFRAMLLYFAYHMTE